MTKSKHFLPVSANLCNPHADRFSHAPNKKSKSVYSRIAYVLQGGGSIGAYQMGVVEVLLNADYEPDWIAATSIGAIQSAIIVGNKPQNRMPKLKEFWKRIATYTPFDELATKDATKNFYNQMGSMSAILLGQPQFYYPRWNPPMTHTEGTPATLSFYDTSPLRETLLDLVDFEILNSSMTRLSLGSVCVDTGQLVYFNNINYLITPEHIMASGALAPGFPAIKIDGKYYWDGGIHSNTPLEVILDAEPPADTLCFVIDCFGGNPFIPTNLDGIAERMKDIEYSTHAQRSIKHQIEKQDLQVKLQKLYHMLPPDKQREMKTELSSLVPHHQTLVHVAHSAPYHKGSSKDYNFGHATINQRISCGIKDAQAILSEAHLWSTRNIEDNECRLYEAPNNLNRLFPNEEFN